MSAVAVDAKCCSRCGEEKPLHAFSCQKAGRHGRRAECKDCQRVYNTAWKRENREHVRAVDRAYYDANRDEILAYNRAWNDANRDRVNEAIRRYRRRNPETIAMAKALRRKLGASRESAALALQRVEYYGGCCRYCRAPADTIDHRIPICRGGTNLPANLVPACRSCNSRKGPKTEREFLAFLKREGVKPNPHGRITDPALV